MPSQWRPIALLTPPMPGPCQECRCETLGAAYAVLETAPDVNLLQPDDDRDEAREQVGRVVVSQPQELRHRERTLAP